MSDTNRNRLLESCRVGLVKQIDFELRDVHGFENAPNTLLRLNTGASFGKQLLEI